jgi:hypothetical protein
VKKVAWGNFVDLQNLREMCIMIGRADGWQAASLILARFWIVFFVYLSEFT